MSLVTTWRDVAQALAGPFDTEPIKRIPLTLPYGGTNGQRHFHPDCPPLQPNREPVPNPQYTHTTVGQLAKDVTPSRWHHCAQPLDTWLGHDVLLEVALLNQAHTVTEPLRTCLDSSARRGRDMVPLDNTAYTQGHLDSTLAHVRAYTAEHPHRDHMTALEHQLTHYHDTWTRLLTNAERIHDQDPLAPIWAWQTDEGLPALTGSTRQVRWAERIRYRAAHDNTATRRMLENETSASAWIGMETNGDVSEHAWYAMADRAAERAARQRHTCQCYPHCTC